MTDDDLSTSLEPTRIRHGSSLGRRFFGFFGIKSARAKREDNRE